MPSARSSVCLDLIARSSLRAEVIEEEDTQCFCHGRQLPLRMPDQAKRSRQRNIVDWKANQVVGTCERKSRHNRDAETGGHTAQHRIHFCSVEHHPRLEPGLAAQLQRPLAQLVAGLEQDEWLIRQCACQHCATRCQAMVCPNGEHQILGEELGAGNSGDRHRHDCEVDAPFREQLEKPSGPGLVQLEIDAGILSVECSKRRRQ